MEELIVGGEYYHEQLEALVLKKNGYCHYHGNKGIIGESILIIYSNKHPEWVFTFLLINIGISNRHDLYRLIYKYTG